MMMDDIIISCDSDEVEDTTYSMAIMGDMRRVLSS